MDCAKLQGDCRQVLKTLPDEAVHCCVTSPPYFGLRDYGVDGQIGLEQTPDAYVAELVAVFREVRRVLRKDGTLWLNLGDSYNGSGKGPAGTSSQLGNVVSDAQATNRLTRIDGLKPKDLIGIPWLIAFALRADGWYLRQDIIWHKPNPMPESVTDRCTKAHEYVFLLSKSERYYYDAEAIKEAATGWNGSDFHDGRNALNHPNVGKNRPSMKRSGNKERKPATHRDCPKDGVCGSVPWEGNSRNKRSVWTVNTRPYKEAHFATFPPALITPMILAGCPSGGTVLDPFGGSGTTGEVAESLGRNSILIELNPAYIEIQGRRTAQIGLAI